MLSSPILIILIYNILIPKGTIMLNDAIDEIFKFLILIFALIFLTLGFVTYKRGINKLKIEDSLNEKLNGFKMNSIKRMAFIEGIAIFSTMGYLITLNNIYLIYTLVLLIPFVFVYPSKSRIENELQILINEFDDVNITDDKPKNFFGKNPWIIFPIIIVLVATNYNSYKDLFSNKIVLPNVEIDNGILNDTIYTNKFLGWTILIPSGYEITPLSELKKYQKKGEKILKSKAPSDKEEIKLLHVKNEFVDFRSSISFREAYPKVKNLMDYSELVENLIMKLTNESMIVEKVYEGGFPIDSLDFYIKEFHITGKNKVGIINISYVSEDYIIDLSMNYTDSNEASRFLERLKNSKIENL